MQWLRLDKQDKLLIQDGAKDHLSKMSPNNPLSVIAIFGAARQGKSYLMNKLAGDGGCGFAVSNRQDPCTVGVDIAKNTKTLQEFCSVDPTSSLLKDRNAQALMKQNSKIRVGFIDVEGQGDRDAAYDARIATSVLLVAKCVIFNWRDSLQKDKLLDMLGVMCRSALSVKLNDENDQNHGSGGGGGGFAKPFGHLHIVFRDWNYDGDKHSIEKQLLGIETEDKEDSIRRNTVRRQLMKAFESVTICLLPLPVEKTKDMKKVLTNDILSSEFNDAVNEVRQGICEQLVSGPRLWSNKPLTGPKISKLVPYIADALNEGKQVLPCSAFQSMIRGELSTLKSESEVALKSFLTKTREEMSQNASQSIHQFLSDIKTSPILKNDAIKCSNRIDEFRNELQEKWRNELTEILTDIENQYKDKVMIITDDNKVIQEQIDLFHNEQIDKQYSLTLTQLHRDAMWPFAVASGRVRLEVQYNDLYDHLPTPQAELIQTLDDLLASITHELSSFSELKINKTEIDNSLESLKDKAQLLLQELSDKNNELEEEIREAEQELCDLAMAALVGKMTEEETLKSESNAAKGYSTASSGLSGDRCGVLTSAICEQLEPKLESMGSDEGRIAELVAQVMDAGQEKLNDLLKMRRDVLEKDITHVAMSQQKWLCGIVMKELMVEAQDITIPSGDGYSTDKRTSLTDLLHRLSTAADIAITAIAKIGGIASPNQIASLINLPKYENRENVDFETFKNILFKKFQQDIENEVDKLKVDLQQAKEVSNATVRLTIQKEEEAVKEALLAKERMEQEKLRIEAENERKRIEKEEKIRNEKVKKEKIRLEKIQLEKEEKAKEKQRLKEIELQKAKQQAEKEAFELATTKAEEAAQQLAQEKAKNAAIKHAQKLKKLKDEKDTYDEERERLAAEREEVSDHGMVISEEEDEEEVIVPLKTSRRANTTASSNTVTTIAKAKKQASTSSSKKNKSSASGGGAKLSVAEAKEKMRAEQAERAKKRVNELGLDSATEESATNSSKRRSSVGVGKAKRSKT